MIIGDPQSQIFDAAMELERPELLRLALLIRLMGSSDEDMRARARKELAGVLLRLAGIRNDAQVEAFLEQEPGTPFPMSNVAGQLHRFLSQEEPGPVTPIAALTPGMDDDLRRARTDGDEANDNVS